MNKLSLLILPIFLFACGGGGGGEGGSSDTAIRIINAIIDLEPVSLQQDKDEGGIELSRQSFLGSSEYSSLNKGESIFRVFRLENLATPVSIQNFEVEEKTKYSILMYGNTSRLGVNAKLVADSFPEEIDSESTAIRVINSVVGVDNFTVSYGGSELFSNVEYSGVSSYKVITSLQANSTLLIRRKDTGRVIYSGAKALTPGKAMTFVVAGEDNLFVTAKEYTDS